MDSSHTNTSSLSRKPEQSTSVSTSISVPYKEVLQIMVDNDWDGYLVSEYEGRRKDEPDFLYDQLRRQHIMIKRIIGY